MSRAEELKKSAVSALIAIVLVAAMAGLSTLGPPSLESVGVLAVINLVLVLGTYVFVGNSGVISFGQMAFAAIGGYVAGVVRMPVAQKETFLPDAPGFLAGVEVGTVAAILIGALVAAAIAALLAVPLMRLSGISAGLATLALLFIVQVVARSWDEVTRGSQALTPLPIDIDLGSALVWAIIVTVVVIGYQTLSHGLLIRAGRDDAVAARAIGVSIVGERSVAFVLSAFICGIGGGLMALRIGSIDPQLFFISITFLVLTMLVIGGTSSVGGAVVGTIVVSVIVEVLRRAQTGDLGFFQIPSRPGVQTLVLAVVLFLIIRFRPEGLTGGRELSLPKLSLKKTGGTK